MTALKQEALPSAEQRLGTSDKSSLPVGKRSGNCVRCGRRLTDPVSVERGMGPVRWAETQGDVFEGDLDAAPEEWARREETLRTGGEIDLGCNWQYIQHDPEMALQIPQTMRVSLRFKGGQFEAYGAVANWGEGNRLREIVFGSSVDIRTVYRMAVNAGPQSSAAANRLMESNRGAARHNRQRKEERAW